MSELDGLMLAVVANPDDDTVRLACADWFDENGQPERAEFIRLQVESAAIGATPTTDADKQWLTAASARCKTLMEANWCQFLCTDPCPDCTVDECGNHVKCTPCSLGGDRGGLSNSEVRSVWFRRGFPEKVGCSWASLFYFQGDDPPVEGRIGPWGRSVVRWWPVTKFVVNDRRPSAVFSHPYASPMVRPFPPPGETWYAWNSGRFLSVRLRRTSITLPILKALRHGAERVVAGNENEQRIYTTLGAATADLHETLARMAHEDVKARG